MSLLDDFDALSDRADKEIKIQEVSESLYAKKLSSTFSAFGIVTEEEEDFLTKKVSETRRLNLNYKTSFADRVSKLIKNAITPELKAHQSRNIYSIDCRTLRKGDAYEWLSAIAQADIDPIIVIEHITQIPDGDRNIYDDPNYVANMLLRSWKNEDIFVGDLHIDRRKFTVILTCPTEDADKLKRECSLCSYAWIGDIEKYKEFIQQIAEKKVGL